MESLGPTDRGWNAHQNALHGNRMDLDDKAEAYIIGPGNNAYKLFSFYAWELIMAGQKRIGAKLLAERIRYESLLKKREGETFIVNNSYVSYMARKFMRDNPQVGAMFETRERNV